MQPGVLIEVGDAEYLDLLRQGLLAEQPKQTPPSPAKGGDKKGTE